jgi:hypothetical protein
MLTYGIKVVIVIEVRCLSYKVLYLFTNTSNKELRANLDLIEEVQLSAIIKNEAF